MMRAVPSPDDDTPGPVGRTPGRRRPAWEGERIRGGSGLGASFELDWSVSGRCEGQLRVAFAGRHVWASGHRDARMWREFLKGLAGAWAYLEAEQTYPLGTTPRRPSQTLEAIQRQTVNPVEALRLFRLFRANHDLSAWFGVEDGRPASLYVIREGSVMQAETGEAVLRWYLADVLRTLAALGDAVAHRLTLCGCDGGDEANAAWRSRDAHSDEEVEAISTGLDRSRLRALSASPAWPRVSRRVLFSGLDEVRAAARMLAPRLNDEAILRIVTLIHEQPKRETPDLDELSREAKIVLGAVSGEAAYAQGQHLAEWLRVHARAGTNAKRANPEAWLKRLGVALIPFETDESIEAVGFWGPAHGPAVLLNLNGRSSRTPLMRAWSGRSGGARATLAHEICHLLVDRDGALPAAEVLGGSVPHGPEERARAFAAEYLLPRSDAGSAFQQQATPELAVWKLTREHGVSRSLAAWQILNRFGGDHSVMSDDDRRTLLAIAERAQGRVRTAAVPSPG